MSSDGMPQGEVGEPQLMARSLSIHASEYKPASTPVPSMKSNSVKPVKTRDPFETLDYVPFTPSQGICTPSPSNVAAIWMARRCDLTSDGSSLTSMASSSDYGAGPIFVPAGAMYPVYAPMPYSPGAPHPMFASSIPSPHHHHIHGPPPGAAAFFAVPSPMATAPTAGNAFVGSPAPGGLTPGRSIFAQYLVQEGYGSEPSNSPQNCASDGSHSDPSSGQKSDKSLSQRNISPGALEAAITWCADKGLNTTEPPQAIIELASLALAYGINLEAAADLAAAAASGPSTTSSPVKQPSSRQDTNIIRLNARQRRTLRRALDRALSALEEGADGEAPDNNAGPQQQARNQQQQQATYKTPMKTNTFTTNNDEENDEYLQITPSGAINNNNGHGVVAPPPPPQAMVFGSPAYMHPQAHHPQNWAQNSSVPMPMHMQMGFHAVAAAAAENAMAQISMAQQHHAHAAAAAAQAAAAAGYMGTMSPHHHHHSQHMMAISMYQDQAQQGQHSMGQGAARGRMNRNQSRFAPKVAAN